MFLFHFFLWIHSFLLLFFFPSVNRNLLLRAPLLHHNFNLQGFKAGDFNPDSAWPLDSNAQSYSPWQSLRVPFLVLRITRLTPFGAMCPARVQICGQVFGATLHDLCKGKFLYEVSLGMEEMNVYTCWIPAYFGMSFFFAFIHVW